MLPVISNSFILQWGRYTTGNNTDVYFPTTFSTFYSITATVINSTSTGYYVINRFPYSITTSKFSHSKGTVSEDVGYLATGKKT